jgi:magnesium-transporting ATPase (P-type)
VTTPHRTTAERAPPPAAAAATPADSPWHMLSVEAAAARVGSPLATGLTQAEAARRLIEHGKNELRDQEARGPLSILFGQFTDFMIVLLIVAAVVSGLIGELEDSIAILAIVVLNAVIGFVQEYRAERAVQALRRLAAPQARALRDGQGRACRRRSWCRGTWCCWKRAASCPRTSASPKRSSSASRRRR